MNISEGLKDYLEYDLKKYKYELFNSYSKYKNIWIIKHKPDFNWYMNDVLEKMKLIPFVRNQ